MATYPDVQDEEIRLFYDIRVAYGEPGYVNVYGQRVNLAVGQPA